MITCTDIGTLIGLGLMIFFGLMALLELEATFHAYRSKLARHRAQTLRFVYPVSRVHDFIDTGEKLDQLVVRRRMHHHGY